ncbi:hypothetical protein C1H76_3016 [Elsinoe australis]|uniref:Uncharacterized protein n=1 Tax=Elsinoe australis TaxID=40998 RepID=A0A4U7B5M9_9PEZI|nr:hypothetical protein C1H76_3016 [Elsinoe australis]
MTSEARTADSTTRVGNSRVFSGLDTSGESPSTFARTDGGLRTLPTGSSQFQGEVSRTKADRPRPTFSSRSFGPGRVPFAGPTTTRAPRPAITNFPRPVVPPRIPLSDLLSSLESALSNASAETATEAPRPITTRVATTSSFGPFIANASTTWPGFPTVRPSSTLLTTTSLPTLAAPSLTPPPPPVPSTQPTVANTPSSTPSSAPESVSLTAATIGGITVGCAASFGLLVLLAFMIWRKRREQYRPSYLEASWGDDADPDMQSNHQNPLLEDHPAFRAIDSTLAAPPARPLTPPQPYVNPYYAVLAQRNPNVFGPKSPPPPKPARINFKRRKSMFLLKGWERTRLSEIPEELEDPFDEKEPDFRRTVYEELGRFKFWESREELMEDGYREVADGEEYGEQDDENEEREVDDMVDVQL